MKHHVLKHSIVLTGLFLLFICKNSIAQELTPPQLIPEPANDDEYFFNFRLKHFAPDTEPLIAQTFGDNLQIEDEGFWVYNSYTSCAISFSTNLPTITLIEYGKTQAYGQVTTQSDSYFYRHLLYLKGLESNTMYHYRIKIQDYQGNTIVSPDKTFTTKELTSDIIRIPEDFGNVPPPYTLTKNNAKYVVTKDIVAPTLAFNIKANNTEIDLDGHTIIYDNETPVVIGSGWTDYAYNEEASFGIRAGLWNFTNFKVFNGTIKQGANGGMGYVGIGFNPLFLNHMGTGSYNEVAGITIDYYGASVAGMVAGDGYVHHNIIIDRGSVIDNRHQAIRAISGGNNDKNEIAYNSLRRSRHWGIDGIGKIHHNELYSDSFDSNSFLIGGGNNSVVNHNKLFGMGYNPVGTGWSSNMVIKNNFIYFHGTAPTYRSTEYARLSGIAGMRLTLYANDEIEYKNVLYEDNTISLKAWEGCNLARGIWTASGPQNKGTIYRRNTVKVEAISDKINFTDVNAAITCVDINGNEPALGSPLPTPLLFEDNIFIGNVNLITIGSGYGIGENARFYRTKMERINAVDQYFTPVRLGFWYWNTRQNYIIDAIPGAGVNLEPPVFFGNDGYMEVYYGITKKLLITTCRGDVLRNSDITITSTGISPIITKTDNEGYVTFEMLTVRYLKENKSISRTNYSPYKFHITGSDYEVATDVLKNMDKITFDFPECNVGLATENGENSSINIYPNPAKDYFFINGLKGNETIQVIDISGRLALTHKATKSTESIPLKSLFSGIYFVKITGKKTTETFKFVVE